MNEQLAVIEQAQSKLIDLGIEFGPRLFVASLILVAGFYVGRWLSHMTDNMLARLQLDVTARHLIVRMVHVLVIGLFLIMALQNLGVDLLPLIAGLGVAGAGIALAMQGVLSNLAAGLTIIFTRPFLVGHYISIVGEEGRVEEITLFNTTLSHPDLSKVVIPNRKIAGEILHNYGEIRQLDLKVSVAYDTDMNQALSVVDEALRDNPRVLRDPLPNVLVTSLSDSSVNISVKPWVSVTDYAPAIGELNISLLETFRTKGINIPFPQREVRLLDNT